MIIDWVHFSPWTSLAGGGLIGLAAATLILFNGRVAGISGVIGTVMTSRPKAVDAWRWLFILGLLAAAPLWRLWSDLPAFVDYASVPQLAVSGLLVGLGTRFGSGCTSGHGVCGLSRGSTRSLVATVTFMAAAFTTVYIMRHA